MYLSILGIVTIITTIVILIIKPSMKRIKILFILLGLQIFFIFRDGFFLFYYIESFSTRSFILGSASLIGLLALYVWLWVKNHLKMIRICSWIMACFILLSVIYTEYFNGFYSFDSYEEYQSYYQVMKENYYYVPFKLTKDSSQHHKTNMYHPNCNCEVSAKFFYISPFFPKSLSMYEDTVYYYIGSEDQRHTYWIEVGKDTLEQIYTIYNQRRSDGVFRDNY